MRKCENVEVGYQLPFAGKVYRHFEPPEGLSLAGGEKSLKKQFGKLEVWKWVAGYQLAVAGKVYRHSSRLKV